MGVLTGIIAGKVLDKVLDRALDRVLESPNLPIKDKGEAEAVKQVVMAEAAKEMVSQDRHRSNAEPWYQSRVTWGALGTLFAGIGGCLQLYTDNLPNSFDDYQLHLVAVGGALTTLWGRWMSTKPIGE